MKFTFKDDAKAEIGSEDPLYELTDGGYLKPDDVLADAADATRVNAAVDSVKGFIRLVACDGDCRVRKAATTRGES